VFVARAIDANSSTTATSTSSKEVVEVYSKTLEEYMTHNKSELHSTFLNDYFKRHTIRAWPLHKVLLTYLQPGKAIKIRRQTTAYELLALLAPQLPTISKTHKNEVDEMIPKAVDAFYATLEATKSDEGWKADRLKEVLKSILAFSRATKSIGYEWDVERLDRVKEELKESRVGKFGSVNGLLNQLRSVVAKSDVSTKTKSKKRSNAEVSQDADVDMDKNDDEPAVAAPKKRKESSTSSKPKSTKKAKAPKA
jgi:hypothetical protein